VIELLGVYLAGILMTAVIGAFYFKSDDRAQYRLGARLILLSVIWPVPLLVAVWKGITYLWGIADWRNL
jgi:hypothetical protein